MRWLISSAQILVDTITRAAQEDILFRLWRLFGDSALGHWFGELWTWW